MRAEDTRAAAERYVGAMWKEINTALVADSDDAAATAVAQGVDAVVHALLYVGDRIHEQAEMLDNLIPMAGRGV